MTPTDPRRCPIVYAAGHGAGTREQRRLQLSALRGDLIRIHRGVYVAADVWSGLDARGRHVVLTRAVTAGLDGRCVIGHHTAAAVWGLPRVHDDYGDVVTVFDPRRSTTSRSTHLLRRPGMVTPDDQVVDDGLRLTTIERTAVDVARTASFADAVLCVDAVLRRLVLPHGDRPLDPVVVRALDSRRADLLGRLGPPSHPGNRSARRVLEFASPLAESAGESLLRVVLFELGLSHVELQRVCRDRGRFAGRCDAFLAESGVAIEFDGHAKLTDPEMLQGRRPADVLRERSRRDRRLLGDPAIRVVVHCEYIDLVQPERLAGLLRSAGVPLDPRRVTAAARIARRRFTGVTS